MIEGVSGIGRYDLAVSAKRDSDGLKVILTLFRERGPGRWLPEDGWSLTFEAPINAEELDNKIRELGEKMIRDYMTTHH